MLLVDDHAVVRRGLRGFLELLKDFDVVGEAENGREGVAAADRLVPDVILMDLLMPEMGGLEAIAAIKQAHPEIEIVAVTSFIEEEKVTSALEAGASGYLLKDAEAEEVAQAIRAAYNGEVHLDPAVSRLLAQRLRQRKDAEPVEPLTAREKEVLSQLAKGAVEQGDRLRARHHRAHGAHPRVEHPRQARPRLAHPGCPVRGRAQARLTRAGELPSASRHASPPNGSSGRVVERRERPGHDHAPPEAGGALPSEAEGGPVSRPASVRRGGGLGGRRAEPRRQDRRERLEGGADQAHRAAVDAEDVHGHQRRSG